MARSLDGAFLLDVHDVLLSNELDGALRVARTGPVSSIVRLGWGIPWNRCVGGTRSSS